MPGQPPSVAKSRPAGGTYKIIPATLQSPAVAGTIQLVPPAEPLMTSIAEHVARLCCSADPQGTPFPSLARRIGDVRRRLGRRLLILGHHYQQDEVIALSDLRGDAISSAPRPRPRACRAIAFCGVHFMAKTADILANRPEQLAGGAAGATVILPDLRPAARWPTWPSRPGRGLLGAVVRRAGHAGRDAGDLRQLRGRLKAFCGRHHGIVCTSANARAVLQWAFHGGAIALLPRPAPGPQHRPPHGRGPGRDAPLGPGQDGM